MRKGFVETLLKFLDELDVPYQPDAENIDSIVSLTFPDLMLKFQLHFIGGKKIDDEASKNERVIHLWEDQWMYHQEKIKSKIQSLLGLTTKIHGRQTRIVKLNNDQLIEFLHKHHLNVPIKAKYKYGLYYNNELVAVMSFSKGRPINRHGRTYNSFELLRYCNKLHMTVVGGVGKLLNHFIREQSPDDIMTYVDADWSDGRSLVPLGFKQIAFKNPMNFYLNVKTGEREYEEMLLLKLGLSIETPLKERHEVLLNEGYICVYNSGSYKYILDLKLLSD